MSSEIGWLIQSKFINVSHIFITMNSVPFYIQIGTHLIKTQARLNARLATVLRKEGLTMSDFSECNYQMECGKCVVMIEGCRNQVERAEMDFLSGMGFSEETFRCSCQVRVTEDFKDAIVKLV